MRIALVALLAFLSGCTVRLWNDTLYGEPITTPAEFHLPGSGIAHGDGVLWVAVPPELARELPRVDGGNASREPCAFLALTTCDAERYAAATRLTLRLSMVKDPKGEPKIVGDAASLACERPTSPCSGRLAVAVHSAAPPHRVPLALAPGAELRVVLEPPEPRPALEKVALTPLFVAGDVVLGYLCLSSGSWVFLFADA